MTTVAKTAIGKPTRLMDGRAKVMGALRFAAGLNVPDLLHARMVLSSYAHANIRGIDVAQALQIPGVVAVLTAHDLPDIEPESRVRLLLARDRVIFAGQPVALVLGTSEAAAEDGAEQVYIDYEPLPAAATIDAALEPGAPLVWPQGIPGGTDESAAHGASSGGEDTGSHARTNIAKHFTKSRGDIQQGFAQAEVIVERTFNTAIVHQSYIEPHATLVQPDPLTGGMTVWSSTQAPFWVRDEVAGVLGIPDTQVRVIGTPVGGGFGGKIVLYEPLVAAAARAVGRPVKLVLTRLEEMVAGNPAPATRIWLRLGARRDGNLCALEAKIIVDSGCFTSGLGGSIAYLLASVYRVPNYYIDSTEVLTFKASASAYRAPGAPQAAFALETVMDEIAGALNIDALEFRLKNASRPGDPTSDDKPWPGMGLSEVLQALRAHPAWQQRETARAAGRGVGVAVGGWNGGAEPTTATCRVERDGTVHVQVGSADLSGTATSFALMVAEVMGVPVENVRVAVGDTANAPYAGGSVGSKTLYTVGPAVVAAAREARAQALAIAADELEADAADLEIVDGLIRVRGVPHRTIPLSEIALKTMEWAGKYAPIFAHGRHADPAQSPGFCAQLAEVEVDSETGLVQVHRLVIAQDAGRAVNPAAVAGQMVGGATQGLGWALYERLAYDDQGQVLSGSWMDYTVPASTQAAGSYETIIVEVPTEHGPFGARGVGEPPVIATAAAVANAIAAATGVRLTDLPMTPPRVLAALSAAGGH